MLPSMNSATWPRISARWHTRSRRCSQRVARDLHDSVKQQTFAVTLLIGAAKKVLDTDLTVARTYLAEAEELSDQTRQELTVIIQEMRSLALFERGLMVVLQEYIERWSHRSAIATEVRFQQAEQAFSPEIEEVLLRVTQEALTNIARHSGAAQGRIELTSEDEQVCLGPCLKVASSERPLLRRRVHEEFLEIKIPSVQRRGLSRSDFL
jgi:two-component system, NarL family, sensor histidine kinase LiaS